LTDIINKPPHYTHGDIEPIDVIESWQLGFCVGNALKYIARYRHKGAPVADLSKAIWYLQRELTRMQDAAFDRATGLLDDTGREVAP
jgi:hypothetical protein